MREPFGYRIVVEWSDEDEAFAARVPALAGCAAHGPSAEDATRARRWSRRRVLSTRCARTAISSRPGM
jgi:hypothetical protein